MSKLGNKIETILYAFENLPLTASQRRDYSKQLRKEFLAILEQEQRKYERKIKEIDKRYGLELYLERYKYERLSDEEKQKIIQLHEQGLSYREIGRRLKISYNTARKIVLKKLNTQKI